MCGPGVQRNAASMGASTTVAGGTGGSREMSLAKRAVLSARKAVAQTRGAGNSTGARTVARSAKRYGWKTGTVGEAYGKMNEMRRGREAEEQNWEARG